LITRTTRRPLLRGAAVFFAPPDSAHPDGSWQLFEVEVFSMEVKMKVIYRAQANGEKAEKKARSSPKKKCHGRKDAGC